MTVVLKIICVLSCGLMLGLGVSPAEAHNDEAVIAGEAHFALRGGGEEPAATQRNKMAQGQPKGGNTMKGEMLRVDDANYFVPRPEEKEGRLRIDATTPRARNIDPSNRNETKMKDQNYALPILAGQDTAKLK